jgi:hypothetical protein
MKKGKATAASHPEEYAIFKQLDPEGLGYITTAHVTEMCSKLDAIEHAGVLVGILDPSGSGKCSFDTFVAHYEAVNMIRQGARLKHWHRCYGLGVAGNVAGHMAQAGEAEAGAPKQTTPAALFTFYAPHPHSIDAPDSEVMGRLERFPVTNAIIHFPEEGANVQVEPEMGLYCDIVYSKNGSKVDRLVPRRVAAFNDCSIRQLEGSKKLSEKKNWGFGSKGISLRSIRIDSLDKGTMVDRLVLSSYVKRDGKLNEYSVKAPVRNYLLFHQPLLDWIVDRINNQVDESKWEVILPQLTSASGSDRPTST